MADFFRGGRLREKRKVSPAFSFLKRENSELSGLFRGARSIGGSAPSVVAFFLRNDGISRLSISRSVINPFDAERDPGQSEGERVAITVDSESRKFRPQTQTRGVSECGEGGGCGFWKSIQAATLRLWSFEQAGQAKIWMFVLAMGD